MSELNNFQVYENVLVSGVEYDFSSNRHERIPHRLYADWAVLVNNLAKAVCPSFAAPPFPESLFFQTESIPSDGPYSADADYYFLDYVSAELKAENGHGLKIHFENGRRGGDDPVTMETVGLTGGVSSYIYKHAKSPTAEVCLWHGDEKSAEVAAVIARHRQSCRAKSGKWKTGRGTFLVQKNLKLIPYVHGGVGLEGGERFDDSAEYVEATVSGEIVERYGEALPFSLEGEMTVSNIHRVIGDSLYKFYYCHRFMYAAPESDATLLLSGLEPYEGVLPFDEENLFDRF
jgi:hypothetical protein